MKVKAEVTASRCEAGNMDMRIVVRVETDCRYSGQANGPLIGAIDHALDGCRKAVKDALAESRPRP